MLSSYLQYGQEVNLSEPPKNSFECVFIWKEVEGTSAKTIKSAQEFIQLLNAYYERKFREIPNNIITRAMVISGVAAAPIAFLPKALTDFSILVGMLSVFSAGWISGGVMTATASSLAWVVGGNKLSSEVSEIGLQITEKVLFTILNVLRIPAGLGTLLGLIPSLALQFGTSLLNITCVELADKIMKILPEYLVHDDRQPLLTPSNTLKDPSSGQTTQQVHAYISQQMSNDQYRDNRQLKEQPTINVENTADMENMQSDTAHPNSPPILTYQNAKNDLDKTSLLPKIDEDKIQEDLDKSVHFTSELKPTI